jgi:hypothetical protein
MFQYCELDRMWTAWERWPTKAIAQPYFCVETIDSILSQQSVEGIGEDFVNLFPELHYM